MKEPVYSTDKVVTTAFVLLFIVCGVALVVMGVRSDWSAEFWWAVAEGFSAGGIK